MFGPYHVRWSTRKWYFSQKKTNKQGNDIKILFKNWRMNIFYTLRVKNCKFLYHSFFEGDERKRDHEKYPNFFITLPSRGWKRKRSREISKSRKQCRKETISEPGPLFDKSLYHLSFLRFGLKKQCPRPMF